MNKDAVIFSLMQYRPISLETTSFTSAVLILFIIDEQDNIFIVLTKRSALLSHYAGDYSFPGGAHESSDIDLKMTMQREVEEELHLKQEDYEVIGRVDDFYDRYGNLVRPFVGVMSKNRFDALHVISHEEIESIYYLPLNEITKITVDPSLELITKRKPSYIYRQDTVKVWGLTASILVHIGNIIFALNQLVDKAREGN